MAKAMNKAPGKRPDEKPAVQKANEEPLERVSNWLKAQVTPLNLALAVVVLLGIILRAYRLTEPFGGFHAFNEAFYLSTAQKYLDKGLLSLIFSPNDYNNPPFYSLLLVISFKLFGVSEAAARGVSVAASVLSIIYLYKLVKTIYNEKIGLMAAVIFAFSPGAALIGRNVQLEAVLVLLILSSAYYYVRGIKENRPLLTGIGGALLGLGLVTKVPAILSIPAIAAWETWRRRSLRWVLDKTTLAFAGAFVAFGFPWYLFQLVTNWGNFIGAQAHLASTFQMPGANFMRYAFYDELVWMLSPPIFYASLVATAWMLYKRQPSDILVLLITLVNLVFYTFYHFHTYYLIPVAPLAAVAVARGAYSLRIISWKRIAITSVCLATLSIFFSLLLLGGQKYGKSSFANLESDLGADPDKLTIGVSKIVMDNTGPVLKQYVKRAKLINYPPSPGEKPGQEGPTFILDLRSTDIKDVVPYAILPEQQSRIILFGYAFSQSPPRRHFFTNGEIFVERVGSLTDFGLDEMVVRSPYTVYVPRKL
ncbi:MAG: glycosyltransferase family 39 protein [Actinobacteria bacterium]|nr:glycosyltransferase family 39 protein [Actinomycetota bacterium]